MKELEGLEENEAFFTGLLCGVKLFQQKVITAHERREHLIIDGNIYYIQSGRERLTEMMNRILQ